MTQDAVTFVEPSFAVLAKAVGMSVHGELEPNEVPTSFGWQYPESEPEPDKVDEQSNFEDDEEPTSKGKGIHYAYARSCI